MKNKMLVVCIAILLAIIAGALTGSFLQYIFTNYIHIFEDGSFGIGNFPYILQGCFPWGICQ